MTHTVKNISATSLAERHQERLAKPTHPLWIASTFFTSYLLNLAGSTSGIAWLPDFLALNLIYWTVRYPKYIGMTIAFICGILMDIHNGSVLGQQALAYITISYWAVSLQRRLQRFSLISQALHVLPLLLLSQIIVLLIRLWFDGLWPGFSWFMQSFSGTLIWPFFCLLLSLIEKRTNNRDAL